MKLFRIQACMLSFTLLVLAGCDKEDVEKLSPEKEAVIGNWQLTHLTQDGVKYEAVNNSRIEINRGGSSLGDGTYALNLYYRTQDPTVPYGYSNGGTWLLKDSNQLVLNGDVDAHYKVSSVTANTLTLERPEKVVTASGRFVMKHRENAINPTDSVNVMTNSPVVYTFEKKK